VSVLYRIVERFEDGDRGPCTGFRERGPARESAPPPAGWRTERLAFPLDFAPELDREREDLAYAPVDVRARLGLLLLSNALAPSLVGDVEVDGACSRASSRRTTAACAER
jgi:hypothetical protein